MLGPTTIQFDPISPGSTTCTTAIQWPDYSAADNQQVTFKTGTANMSFTINFPAGTPFQGGTTSMTFTSANPAGPYAIAQNAASPCNSSYGCYYPYTVNMNGATCMGGAPPNNTYGMHIKP